MNLISHGGFFCLGLSRSGNSVCRYLSSLSPKPTLWGWDDQSSARESLKELPIHLQESSIPWSNIQALILSPGIPFYGPKAHPIVKEALDHNIPLWSDIELFIRLFKPNPMIAVTGSNGKSTISNLIAHLLNVLGMPALALGNIGVPVFQAYGRINHKVIVLEMSSYLLETTPSLSPEVGLINHLTPDHMDRHFSFYFYQMVKMSLLATSKSWVLPYHQGISPLAKSLKKDITLIGDQNSIHIKNRSLWKQKTLVGRFPRGLFDYPHNQTNMAFAWGAVEALFAQKGWASIPDFLNRNAKTPGGGQAVPRAKKDISLCHDILPSLFQAFESPTHPSGGPDLANVAPFLSSFLQDSSDQSLKTFWKLILEKPWTKGGRDLTYLAKKKEIYNIEKVYQRPEPSGPKTSQALEEVFIHTTQTFPGLPHRLEKVGQWNNITFINDSKSTNLESTELALSNFSHSSTILLLGGQEKSQVFSIPLHKFPWVRGCFLFGQSRYLYQDQIQKTGKPSWIFQDLKGAFLGSLNFASDLAGECTILLSPGCASFDQFRNFEERGELFRSLCLNFLKSQTESLSEREGDPAS